MYKGFQSGLNSIVATIPMRDTCVTSKETINNTDVTPCSVVGITNRVFRAWAMVR